ncbi:MAG: sulfotransferase [Pseudomonadota bacterium]
MNQGDTPSEDWRSAHPAPGPLILQIGFNKCGTRSISRLMGQNGIPRADWQRGKIARLAWARQQKGEPPFADYPGVIGFTDMENMLLGPAQMVEYYREFAYMYQHYPDAYFILNTRSKEAWLRSRLNHKNYVLKYRRFYRVLSREAVVKRWAEDWDAHHAAVRAFFADKPGRLCEFNIETDDLTKLAAFLAPSYAITSTELPHRGETARPRGLVRRPGWIKPNAVRRALGLPEQQE